MQSPLRENLAAPLLCALSRLQSEVVEISFIMAGFWLLLPCCLCLLPNLGLPPCPDGTKV